MVRLLGVLSLLSALAPLAEAQEAYDQQYVPQTYETYGGDFYGPASVGSGEPLYSYDDQEPWKHGYLHVMPFYGGHHVFLPYNYKAILSQSQVAAGWGMSNVMPYSQQFWHRYEQQADLSQPRVVPHPLPRPGELPPGGEALPPTNAQFAPASPNAPDEGAVPTAYAAPVNSREPTEINRPRGGQSLRGPRLP